MQANGRLQCWNSRGLRPQSRVEAAARKRPQGALGMDALTTVTEGYARKRPEEHFKRSERLKDGKRAATLEQQGLTATGLGGSCREEAAARRPRHGRPNNRGICTQTAGGAF